MSRRERPRRAALAIWLRYIFIHVVPLNPAPGSKWTASRPGVAEEFVDRIAAHGVAVTVRDTRGREIDGACGQLAAGDRAHAWMIPVHNAWVITQRLTRRIGDARRRAASRVVHWLWRELQRAGEVSPGMPAARAFREFGAGSAMTFPLGSVFNEEWITIGADTLIAEQVTMSAGIMPGHDLGPDPVLRVGDRCVIGRGSHVVAHQSIEIGDDVWTGPYVYITDQNHGYADPDTPIGRQFPVNRPVSIGAGSWLGAGAIVLPGTRIGRNVVVAAGSVVRGEIPDRCVVAGVPARIVRQHTDAGWGPAADAPVPA